MEYLNRLDLTPNGDGKTWRLLGDFRFSTNSRGTESEEMTVPEGFQTDFASVPPFLWSIISRWGKHGFGAVIHDWLYWNQHVTRKEADLIFLEAMEASHVGFFRRRIVYRALRLVGWTAWNSNKSNKKKKEIVADKQRTSSGRPPRGVPATKREIFRRWVLTLSSTILFGLAIWKIVELYILFT